MASRVSDQEFIALWRELLGATAVAQRLGVTARAATARRRRIESRHGVVLPVDDHRPAYRKMDVTIKRHAAVIDIQIDDGVVLVGSDFHIWPGEWTTMQKAFIHLCRELKPAAVVANGDICDLPGISRFAALSWNDMRRKPSVKEELSAVADYLGEVVAASSGAQHIWCFGNHDQRFEMRLASAAPEFEGVPGMSLKDHFPLWRPCWRVDVNDNVTIRHRELGGEHADYRNVLTQGRTMVTGHDHRTGVVPYRSYSGTHYGVRCGYMADAASDPQFVEYLEAREPNWHPGFCVLTFRAGRLLYPELCLKVDDDLVQFRGQLIELEPAEEKPAARRKGAKQ